MSNARNQQATPKRGPGGRGVGLTKEEIVTAAIRVIDRDGVGALTMRRIGDDLGVQAQALYWHFKNKDALCRAVVDALSAEFDEQPEPSGSPLEQLADHLRAIRQHWRRHPAAAQLGARYVPTVAGARARQASELLRELGVPDDRVLNTLRSLIWTAIGFVLVEQSIERSAHHRRIGDGSGHYEVVLPIEGDEPTAAELDTDELFETTIALALRGVETDTASGERP